MTAVKLTGNFLATARCLIFADGGGVSWNFNPNTNTLTASASSGGTFLSSVGFADISTTPIYTVTNSPLTANGTLDIALKAQTAAFVFAGPTTGVATQPTFRALVTTDIPALAYVTSIGSTSLTIGGTASVPTVNLSSTQITNIGLGGTALQTASVIDSITGAGTVGSPLQLSGDAASPGNSFYYGTNAAGTKGWYSSEAGANPSASVGLSAVNGSAATWMRSDGAPALSQAITPIWTGKQTFAGTFSYSTTQIGIALGANSGNPIQQWTQPSGGADSKLWDNYADTTTMHWRVVNDAVSLAPDWFSAARTGIASVIVTFGLGSLAVPKSPLASATTQVFTGLANFKSALSTAASAVLTTDAALTVTCNETGWYDVDAYLVFYEATSGTGGFQFDFNGGGATVANPSFAVNGFSTAAFSNAATTSISTATGIGTVGTSSAAPSWARVKGTIQVTVVGTFAIRWAQNTILAIDPTTLAAGSKIVLTKIG